MVAKINHGSSLYGALAYNQEKVNEGLGKVLGTNLVLEPTDGRFSVASSMMDFERLMPAHIRTQKPVIHVSLNPHPDDKLTDEQLADIGREYMERLGYGGQPYMIFKHHDIGREHIHIVASRVQTDGKLVPDKFEKERSAKIVTDLEREYFLIPAKGQTQGEAWLLSPVDAPQGNLKKQVSNVLHALNEKYRFGSFGEYRSLLSLYNIGIEEVRGSNRGTEYKGVVYSVLDADGRRVGKPLKSSLFGKSYGLDGLEKRYAKSTETIKSGGFVARTRAFVSDSLAIADSGDGFRAKLREQGIDLVIRHNAAGRLVGATYIDHNDRTVFNGSALGKEFSANKLAERFVDFAREAAHIKEMNMPTVASALQSFIPITSSGATTDAQMQSQPDKNANRPKEKNHSVGGEVVGGLLSILTPEVHPDDNQPLPKPRKKIKRKYGRQM
ncbi:conjugal transfer protein MobB [Dysgonomonas sp.]